MHIKLPRSHEIESCPPCHASADVVGWSGEMRWMITTRSVSSGRLKWTLADGVGRLVAF